MLAVFASGVGALGMSKMHILEELKPLLDGRENCVYEEVTISVRQLREIVEQLEIGDKLANLVASFVLAEPSLSHFIDHHPQ